MDAPYYMCCVLMAAKAGLPHGGISPSRSQGDCFITGATPEMRGPSPGNSGKSRVRYPGVKAAMSMKLTRQFAVAIALAAAALIETSGSAQADTVGSASSVGLATEYNSNPFPLQPNGKPAESVAALVNLPITYNSDQLQFDLIPRLRYAATHDANALLTDYQYLDSDYKFTNEKNILSATADWHHESTIYDIFENSTSNGKAIQRTSELASLGWERVFNPKNDLQLQGSYGRIEYSADPAHTLTPYNYEQGTLEYDHTVSERVLWDVVGGVTQFDVIGGTYRSQNRFAQVGLTDSLSELWLVKLLAGYSSLTDHSVQLVLFGVLPIGPYCLQFVEVPTPEHSKRQSGNGSAAP